MIFFDLLHFESLCNMTGLTFVLLKMVLVFIRDDEVTKAPLIPGDQAGVVSFVL